MLVRPNFTKKFNKPMSKALHITIFFKPCLKGISKKNTHPQLVERWVDRSNIYLFGHLLNTDVLRSMVQKHKPIN